MQQSNKPVVCLGGFTSAPAPMAGRRSAEFWGTWSRKIGVRVAAQSLEDDYSEESGANSVCADWL